MANSINTNIAAYFAQANIGFAAQAAANSVARLSSGNRIVRAADDVAALSIGSSLRTSVSTLRIALTNAAQGSTLLQIADGALSQVTEILQRQKAISLQAGSGSLSDTDRGFLDQEFQALTDEIDRITSATNFNNVNLIDGSLAGSNPLRSGATTTATVTGFATQTVGTISAVAVTDAAGTTGDSTFYGDLSQGVFNVDFIADDDFSVTFAINGSTYTGSILDGAASGGTIVLTNGEADITFTVAADLTAVGVSLDAAGATALQTALTASFAGATGFANRTVLTTDATGVPNSAIASTDTAGTILQGFNGDDVRLVSQYYNGLNLPSITGFKAFGQPSATGGSYFEVTIDGRTYRTASNTDGTDIGAADAFGNGSGLIRFYLDGDSTTNPNEYLQLDVDESVQVIDIDTTTGVNNFVTALNNLFGTSGGGLSFQVGTASTDVLQVLISSATSSTLFAGAALDVLTQTTAEAAGTALTTALETVAAIRAGVGASQSRFNFASANIATAIQNQDSARSTLLDTDIAAESTDYATAQVKLQAGISVLAQANQQLQSLLKLIG